jgi:hypothetical protein
MFVNEFFFSFSLLAFTAALLILGTLILFDGVIRLVRESYKAGKPKPEQEKTPDKVTTFEQAA